MQRADEAVERDCWFRGQIYPWPLRSRLHRVIQRNGNPEDTPTLRQEGFELLGRFQAHAWSQLPPEARNGWALLFASQHVGVPTRLLDFTRSFACALFFSTHNAEYTDAPTVAIVDPHAVNKAAGERGVIPAQDGRLDEYLPNGPIADRELKPVAFAPNMLLPRMQSQQSVFVAGGDSFAPMEDGFPQEVVSVLVLDAEARKQIIPFLCLAGVSAHFFLHDLEYLAQDLRRSLRLDDGRKIIPW